MKRGIVIAVVLAAVVIGVVVLPRTTIHLSYNDAPRLWHHAPTLVATAPLEKWRSGSGSAASTGRSGKGATWQYNISIDNFSSETKRYQYIEEFRDQRGRLVRRNVLGPLDVPPLTSRTWRDTLTIPRSERWYVAREKSSLRPASTLAQLD
jgi:hypothetical protein